MLTLNDIGLHTQVDRSSYISIEDLENVPQSPKSHSSNIVSSKKDIKTKLENHDQPVNNVILNYDSTGNTNLEARANPSKLNTDPRQSHSRRPSFYSVTHLDTHLDTHSANERDLISSMLPSYGTSQEIIRTPQLNSPRERLPDSFKTTKRKQKNDERDNEGVLIGIIYILLGIILSLKAMTPSLTRSEEYQEFDEDNRDLEEGNLIQ